MAQSLSRILIHIIFSTKDRRPLLKDSFRTDLHCFICGIGRDLGCPIISINSVLDHLHLVTVLSRTVEISTLVREVKSGSSKEFRKRLIPDLEWQGGYGAFSVSES